MSIILRNVTKSFLNPPVVIINNINLTIQKGEFVSLTGKSGSGKSTLLYLISSLDTPSSGTVEFEGIEISKMSHKKLHEFRNKEIGFIFQFHYLLPEFTALENVLLPARKAGLLMEKMEYAQKLFIDFDLKDKMNTLPGKLSGGQQQRVAIARAMIMNPSYIFADEPTGALDSANGRIVMDIFKKINQQNNTTIILVTHDTEFASIASRQVVLIDGEIQS